jgi:serine protease Do
MRLHRCGGLAVLACAALACCTATALSGPINPRRTPVVEVVERVRAAVVNIHSERTLQNPADELFNKAPSPNHINGMGTGILIDPRGYIITNQHVVDDISALRIRLSDGSSHSAQVVVRDHDSDLALLKIEVGRLLPTIPLGTSVDLMVGETVIAIGNAYGYEHTVTVGVISAIKRDVTLNKDLSYKALIQTDASINPGNSGGPLLNINGELIGVNVAIRAGAQGIGFAIPVDSVLREAADMLAIRKRSGTTHGLVCRDCVGELENSNIAGRDDSDKSKDAPGMVVPASTATSLSRWLLVERAEPGSPAARAGIQPGDVIIRVGGLRTICGMDLERALLDRAAGDAVPVVVRRKGADQRLDLVLQSIEQAPVASNDLIWRKLGLRLNPVPADQVTRANRQLHGGLAVVSLDPEGVASRSGIQRGDILIGLHQWETVNIDNVQFVLTHPELSTFNPVRFFIIRTGQIHRGWLQQIE